MPAKRAPPAGVAEKAAAAKAKAKARAAAKSDGAGEIPAGQAETAVDETGEEAMPGRELRNMHAHLAAMALKGDSAPKDFYRALTDKSKKRAFLEAWKADKRCKFVCQLVEKRSDAVSDTIEVVEGWMSKLGPELFATGRSEAAAAPFSKTPRCEAKTCRPQLALG